MTDEPPSRPSIKSELELRGIDPEIFASFYNALLETGKSPPKVILGNNQAYNQVRDYLKEQNIFGRTNHVRKKDLYLFEERRQLEAEALETPDEIHPEIRRAGGLLPCVSPQERFGSNGGLAPCRRHDDSY